ncbi:MAG: acyl carrier protein [Lachnospiraceae bacterium]|jgi:acyl carrier protein|nr:acyl carrier protein [Lachnospiraceae bacterium]
MFEKISEIIAEVLSIDASEVDLSSDFKDDLDADSLNLFELVMAIEGEYDVEVPSEDLEGIKTVGDMIEYLKSKGIED